MQKLQKNEKMANWNCWKTVDTMTMTAPLLHARICSWCLLTVDERQHGSIFDHVQMDLFKWSMAVAAETNIAPFMLFRVILVIE